MDKLVDEAKFYGNYTDTKVLKSDMASDGLQEVLFGKIEPEDVSFTFFVRRADFEMADWLDDHGIEFDSPEEGAQTATLPADDDERMQFLVQLKLRFG